jgi:hypothetical protein
MLSRISSLRGNEPCSATTSSPPPKVQAVQSEGDEDRGMQVRSYERAHKKRAGVLKATERELSNA